MKRMHYITALILLVIISVGLIAIQGDKMEKTIAKTGDTVAVDYWLTVDGEQIDTSEGRGLFEFALGSGAVIPGFDKAVIGMSIGEEKTTDITGNDAYTAGPLAGKKLTFRIILREIQE